MNRNGRLPDWIVKRPDFADKFGEVYPAAAYWDMDLLGGGQQNIMGRGDEMNRRMLEREKQNRDKRDKFKLGQKMMAWDKKGDKNKDFVQLYKLLGGD
jgi:hypothetical protein